MCGIFGISLSHEHGLTGKQFRRVIDELFILSESRGKEASGIAGRTGNSVLVHKSPLSASKLIKTGKYDKLVKNITGTSGIKTVIGHSRLVTNGYEHFNKNNQPVVKNGIAAVHNGIIVNDKELWSQLQEPPQSDLDSELIPVKLSECYNEGKDIPTGIVELFSKIEGMTSTALMHWNFDELFLATNNGSLYYTSSGKRDIFLFASEYFILKELVEDKLENIPDLRNNIKQVQAGCYLLYNPATKELQLNNFHSIEQHNVLNRRVIPYTIDLAEEGESKEVNYKNTSFEYLEKSVPVRFSKVYTERKQAIKRLKRCRKCVLPETFPFIEFDKSGKCNYCNNYRPINYLGKEKLFELAGRISRNDGRPECLVPFSGGRDSSFVLHYIVEELGLKPLAYSYDWGMITDLARRNQSRLCGKLGVEHILVSADIRRKREFIRLNVLAWLKKPDLGMIPLFMAGDKQYFYYTKKLLKENQLEVSFMGENLLETTNFKSGFAGIAPNFGNDKTYSLSMTSKFRMLFYYFRQYLTNPKYINSSLPDTFSSFKSYYILNHINVNLFNYIKWDEKSIVETIIDKYDWEIDPGTKTTWRIGDGTAAFYNYIYYMLAGFNENDTFRSNQIREGMLSRENAINLLDAENAARWDSISWYCNTIGIDFENTIDRINSIPTLIRL